MKSRLIRSFKPLNMSTFSTIPNKTEFNKIYSTYDDTKDYMFGCTEKLDTKYYFTDIVKNINVCISESLKSKSTFSIEVENRKIFKHHSFGITKDAEFIELKRQLENLGIKYYIYKHDNPYVFSKYRVNYHFGNKMLDIYI